MNVTPPSSYRAEPNVPGAAQLSWAGHMADDIAATYGPDPLATLTATADGLYLASSRGNFRFPKSAVTKLGKGKFYPWFFSAVRIHHSVAGIPKDLQFKPLALKPREVLDQLRALGYPTV